MIQYNLRGRIPFDINDNMHAFPVGVVFNIRYAFQPFIFDQIGNIFDQSGFIYLVGQFRHDNFETAILFFFNFSPSPHKNTPTTGA